MDASSTSFLLHSIQELKKDRDSTSTSPPMAAAAMKSSFDSSPMRGLSAIPRQFIWPSADRAHASTELRVPVVDLSGFLRGDEASTRRAAELVRSACTAHGFFQVTNHGVEAAVAREALRWMSTFFGLPHARKLSVGRQPGSLWGYAGAHTDRFSSKLPYKETLSFGYNGASGSVEPDVMEYLKSALGEEFENMGRAYERYCEAMRKLSLSLVELLATSLDVDRSVFRRFFEEGTSIMRCNYYPTCQEPELVLGTGPHCDPTSLTILLQDKVAGLEVFADNQWCSVSPVPDALVINIGDTFMALSNGRYKSCMHRAVVNRHSERRSLVFFLCPSGDAVVKPPEQIVLHGEGRKYPDFTWSQLLAFTQKHYRADTRTLQSFVKWLSRQGDADK